MVTMMVQKYDEEYNDDDAKKKQRNKQNSTLVVVGLHFFMKTVLVMYTPELFLSSNTEERFNFFFGFYLTP